MFKRIISFVLVIAILFCFAAPNAFAATEYRSKAVTYGEAYLTYLYNNADDVWNEDSPLPWLGTAIKGITTALNSKICEQSHDGYHASLGESISYEAFGMDEHGRYCLLSCDYCGEWFRCYSSDLIAAYDEYVASLDSTLVGSVPTLKFYDVEFSNVSANIQSVDYDDSVLTIVSSAKFYCSVDFYFKVEETGNYTFNIPYSTCSCGYDHYALYHVHISVYSLYEDGNLILLKDYNSMTGDKTFATTLTPGTVYYLSYQYPTNQSSAGTHIMTYNFEPCISGDLIRNTLEAETRTGSLMQTINNYNVDNSVVDNSSNVNYYISPKSYVTELPDDTIDIEQCYSPQSYDEETLVFTEPVTGAQILSSGWTYNYENRTYDIAVPAGTTTDTLGSDITRIELIYGDEAVTYNYYLADDTLAQSDEYAYVMVSGDETFGTGGSSGDDNTGDDSTGDTEEETHKHSYTDTVTTEPTCEAPGIRKYTCDECGDSYTEKIDAAGHTWTVKQSVATQYDDTGAVTVQGYTIYKCSVCNTEYKDEAGTGPPNNSADNTDGEGIFKKIGQLLGSILSGLLGMIEAVLGGLLDGLVRLANLLGDKLTHVVEIVTGLFDKIPQLFGGFTALLGDVFVFIPEDIMTIFTFGAAAIVFVGILMLFIKR